MPRTGAARAAGGTRPRRGDKLDRCLEALLQNPDAACVAGSEMACCEGGCGSGGELVEGLAGFVSHSDAARRRFVARGGLESVLALVSKAQRSSSNAAGTGSGRAGPGPGSATYNPAHDMDDDEAFDDEQFIHSSNETRALGAMVILQSLTMSTEGQRMLLQRQPQLLHLICQLAASEDADAEGLRSACLQLLGGWHCRLTLKGSNRTAGIAPAVIADWLLSRASTGDKSLDVLAVAMQSACHPMLALRKAAAQLFATAAVLSCRPGDAASATPPGPAVASGASAGASSAPTLGRQAAGAASASASASGAVEQADPFARATAMLSHLAQQVSQMLTELEHSGGPSLAPMGFPAVPPPMFMPGGLGQAILVDLQGAAATKKLQVQSLVEIACALTDEPEGPDLLADAGAVWPLLRAFSIAWDLPASALQQQLLGPDGQPGAVGASTAAAVGHSDADADAAGVASPAFQFSAMPTNGTHKRHPMPGSPGVFGATGGRPLLQDHQGREQVLDALLLLLRHPAGLGTIGAAAMATAHAAISPRTSVAVGLAAFQLHSPRSKAGPALACLGGCLATCRCGYLVPGLRLLHGLVLALLQRETPAHMRSALALLGAVRCAAAAGGPEPISDQGSGLNQGWAAQQQQQDQQQDQQQEQEEQEQQRQRQRQEQQQNQNQQARENVQSVQGGQAGQEGQGKRGGQGGQAKLAAARAAVLTPLTELLELLCQVFDIAWASETNGGVAAGSWDAGARAGPGTGTAVGPWDVTGRAGPQVPLQSPGLSGMAGPSGPGPSFGVPQVPLQSPELSGSGIAGSLGPGPSFGAPQVPLQIPGLSGSGMAGPPEPVPNFGGPQVPLLSVVGVSPAGGRLSASGNGPSFTSIPPSMGRAATPASAENGISNSLGSSSSAAACSATAAAGRLAAPGQGTAGAAALVHIDMGVGYRVLVQVLQAWRQLSDSGDPGVAAALAGTCWWQRVMLARLHDRPQVSAAAEQVKWREGTHSHGGQAQLGAASLEAVQGHRERADDARGAGALTSGRSFPEIQLGLGEGEELQALLLAMEAEGLASPSLRRQVASPDLVPQGNAPASHPEGDAPASHAQDMHAKLPAEPALGPDAGGQAAGLLPLPLEMLYLAPGASQPSGAAMAPVGLHAILPLTNGVTGSPDAPPSDAPMPAWGSASDIAATALADAGRGNGDAGVGKAGMDGEGGGVVQGVGGVGVGVAGMGGGDGGDDEEMLEFLSVFLEGEERPEGGHAADEVVMAGGTEAEVKGLGGARDAGSNSYSTARHADVPNVMANGDGAGHAPVAVGLGNGDRVGQAADGPLECGEQLLAAGSQRSAGQQGREAQLGASGVTNGNATGREAQLGGYVQQGPQRVMDADATSSAAASAQATDLFEPWDGAFLPAPGTLPAGASAADGSLDAGSRAWGSGGLYGAVVKTEEQMVAEAMTLLPDLDAIAEQLCVKYDIVELPDY